MKHLFTLILMAILPIANVCAEETHGVKNDIRYITLTDGQVIAIPEKYILDEEEANGICTLTLEGDTTFTYSSSNVANISDTYNGTGAELLSFAFTHADNDQVYKDVTATITEKGDSILVNAEIPVIGKRLRPSFILSEGATMWVDGEQQVSGQSSHRFTDPITYTLAQPKHWIYEVRTIEPDNNDDAIANWKLTELDITNKVTTNAPNNKNDEGLEKLWDNDISTFFHSTWGDGGPYTKLTWVNGGYYGDGITEWPYLDIELTEPIENFCFSYTTVENNRFPQGWKIYALNSTTDKWDEIGALDDDEYNMPQTYLTEFTSPVFSLGEKYSIIRLELTKASYKNYIVLSELSVFSCEKIEQEPTEPTIVKGFKPFGRPCKVNVKYLTDHATGTYKIPTIYITFGDDTTRWDASQWIGMYTYDEEGNRIWTKEEWIDGCTFQLDGAGVWPDIAKVEGCEVRGRGNSSWSQSYMSKNPFRIKLPKKNKQSPFNPTKDRQWVFIANKQNGSMTSNSIAQKVAAMVDAEALCHMIPVDIYINGHYRGSYCFTEKIGISDNSVAIDETTGCLIELDDYFDEDYKDNGNLYTLPLNVKDPDFTEEDEERIITFEDVKTSFYNLTETLITGGDITQHIDMDTWAKFWLVNDLVRNVETHHPKSCYMFNENPAEDDKWKFGPAWDFDWAFGYEDEHTYFIAGAEEDLFSSVYYQNKAGYRFYDAIRTSEAGKRAYYKEWVNFMAEDRLQELLEYVDDYTAFALTSIKHNNDANVNEKNSTDYEKLANTSKQWLTKRANYIFNHLETFDVSPDIVEPEDYGQPTKIEEATGGINRLVDVYTVSGMLVRRQVPYMNRCNGLEPGLYIIDGKTTIVK